MSRKLTSAFLAICAAMPVFSTAAAPAYPTEKPVTLVVPFSPGGGTDILARLLADKLGVLIRQTVLVVNKPGASGQVAIQSVERARADGYTLLFGSSSTHVLAPMLSPDKEMMGEVRKNFVVVSMVAETPLVLAVKADAPFQSLGQYTDAARTRMLSFGTYGAGSTPHLMGALLALDTGAQLLHVPYKGSSPAISNLLGGQTDSVFLTVAALSGFIEGQQARALAVTGLKRVEALPDVPTFKEAGVSGMEDSGWFAVFASADTPPEIVDSLHAHLAQVLGTPEAQAKLVELGLLSMTGTREHDLAVWQKTINSTQAMLKRVKFDPNK